MAQQIYKASEIGTDIVVFPAWVTAVFQYKDLVDGILGTVILLTTVILGFVRLYILIDRQYRHKKDEDVKNNTKNSK